MANNSTVVDRYLEAIGNLAEMYGLCIGYPVTRGSRLPGRYTVITPAQHRFTVYGLNTLAGFVMGYGFAQREGERKGT